MNLIPSFSYVLAASVLVCGFLPPGGAADGKVLVRSIDRSRIAARRGMSSNAAGAMSRSTSRSALVMPGDWAIPQVADGGSWQTTITLTNMDSRGAAILTVFFTKSDGTEMKLPIVGLGSVDAVELTIPPYNTVNIETEGTAPETSQGWALVVPENDAQFGGFAVFRQRTPDRPDSEAVVPLSSIVHWRTLLVFDNTSNFVTSVAMANPDSTGVFVNAIIRDEEGTEFARETITLGGMTHDAFALPEKWQSTKGRKGSIEFFTTGPGIAMLGLRFNPAGAFTSFQTLTNIDWVVY